MEMTAKKKGNHKEDVITAEVGPKAMKEKPRIQNQVTSKENAARKQDTSSKHAKHISTASLGVFEPTIAKLSLS